MSETTVMPQPVTAPNGSPIEHHALILRSNCGAALPRVGCVEGKTCLRTKQPPTVEAKGGLKETLKIGKVDFGNSLRELLKIEAMHTSHQRLHYLDRILSTEAGSLLVEPI